jgi:hypothetical protein
MGQLSEASKRSGDLRADHGPLAVATLKHCCWRAEKRKDTGEVTDTDSPEVLVEGGKDRPAPGMKRQKGKMIWPRGQGN